VRGLIKDTVSTRAVILGADHVVVLVNDLNAAIETYRRLGFDAQPGGEHPNTGSHNALVALADGVYIELLAFRNPALAEQSHWRDGVRMLRVREGFAAYVLASDDIEHDLVQLRARGVNAGDPTPGSRVRPDGQTVKWKTTFIDATPTGIMPFLIQDETPRTLRIEPAHEGLGARARLSQLVIAVKQLEPAREKYRALLNAEPKHVRNIGGDVEGFRFVVDWGSIVLAHSTVEGNAMADQLAKRGEGLYALTLTVDKLREWSELNKRGINLEKDTNGYLIAPDKACGARIRLAGQ
jgi:catechol 2,3-dioxygenase-like lactoylglutathione lyase family enzyme